MPTRDLHAEPLDAQSVPYCVIAIVRPAAASSLRTALGAIQPVSITATEATIWGPGKALHYRGAECHVDEGVVRLEIACWEHQVAGIVSAIDAVLDAHATPPDARHVVALPMRVAGRSASA